ncbi:MAG: hypothetical protein KY457_00090 [Actinobacteria bacterium]|nr:hypothetical protein [Actinomycetota bacterium]
MRRLSTILIAAVLVIGATACDGGEAEETLDAVGETAGEVAEDVGDALSEAATEASEFADLVGFCDAARRANEAVEARNAGDALEAAEDLAAEAPDDIRDAAETVRDGVAAWHDGDDQAIEDAAFTDALEDVGTYVDERCDPRD